MPEKREKNTPEHGWERVPAKFLKNRYIFPELLKYLPETSLSPFAGLVFPVPGVIFPYQY